MDNGRMLPPVARRTLGTRLSFFLKRLLMRRGKIAFLSSLPQGAAVLDVGCGNDSPLRFKTQRPDIIYTGIDVQDYHHSGLPAEIADRYLEVPSSQFARAVATFAGQADAVVSSHNLEHCDDPDVVLEAMIDAVREGGRLYLSFPSAASIHFPHRKDTLNFFDDGSHVRVPDYRRICTEIERRGLQIDFAAPRYRPLVPFLAGLLFEPVARATKRALSVTWALYGFESVIWASRPRKKYG